MNETAIVALQQVLGDRLSLNPAVREHHSHDMSRQPAHLPDAVVFAESEEDVAQTLKLCHEHGVPVTPFGAGSSMEGLASGSRRSISSFSMLSGLGRENSLLR